MSAKNHRTAVSNFLMKQNPIEMFQITQIERTRQVKPLM